MLSVSLPFHTATIAGGGLRARSKGLVLERQVDCLSGVYEELVLTYLQAFAQ